MTLSHRECHVLSVTEEELAADSRLRAVADLFAQPPPFRSGHVWAGRSPSRFAGASSAIRPAACIVLSAVVTLLGLICCALTAALHIPVVASAAAVLAVCAAMALAVVVIHRRARTTGAGAATVGAPSILTNGGTAREGDEFPT